MQGRGRRVQAIQERGGGWQVQTDLLAECDQRVLLLDRVHAFHRTGRAERLQM